MVMYQIISDGIPVGHFKDKERAQQALERYVDHGHIQEINKESDKSESIQEEEK